MKHLSGAIARELQAVMNGKKIGMNLGDLARMCADELSTRDSDSEDETDTRVIGCWTEGASGSSEIYDWTV